MEIDRRMINDYTLKNMHIKNAYNELFFTITVMYV